MILLQEKKMEKQKLKNVGVAICGSFCTHAKIIDIIKQMIEKGYEVTPIVTNVVATTDTRFGTAKDFIGKLENLCNKNVVKTIVDAEPLGPNNMIDVLVIAPCTGNTLSKLAQAITDNAVLMTAKAHMRNNKPVVVGISSNDSLGINMENIAKLVATKNVYFVPFGQDDFEKKPKSLICDWNLIIDTMLLAFDNVQIQPMLLKQ